MIQKSPFPKHQYPRVQRALTNIPTLLGAKAQGVSGMIDFIHWSGCRPNEACMIFGTNPDGTECLRAPTKEERAQRQDADAVAHITSTKTKRPYTWVFTKADRELYQRLLEVRGCSRRKEI